MIRGFILHIFFLIKTRNLLDCRYYLLHGNQARTLKLPGRVGMARAPQKILVVKAHTHIIPATVAGMVINHPVRGCEFSGRMGETAD